MTSLLDLLQAPACAGDSRVFGVVTGVVTNNQDPEKLGRVRVRFPWLSDEQESSWARVAAPMAGNGRGLWLLPEVDDEVLAAFERGDPRFPYVVGALWNQGSPPPETNEDGRNDVRVLRSRSGHVVRLDDREGEEKIEIADGSGKGSIVVRTGDGGITVTCDGDLTLESKNGKLVLKAKGVEVSSQGAVELEAQGDVGLRASGGGVTVKGNTIDLN
ncbi:MAG TPA: phage baseplate assembly protein V [Longimicrobiaceae bacterium]|nr:phage baseplate assembly protein V [Longimicrobiaceae bacterium]